MSVKYYFVEGQHAFRMGYDIEDCPYEEGSEESAAWKDGWYEEAEDFCND